uniref:Uncharacterized protein n=1 Tax=Anguilla anguilla TaxID=7936 RepID=A0A0E9R957_ANGAN
MEAWGPGLPIDNVIHNIINLSKLAVKFSFHRRLIGADAV